MTDEQKPLLTVGSFTTVGAIDPKLRFEAIGALPVPFRASIVRIVFFKLLGTGVFAALVAISTGSRSCALAAAVNAVACAHYFAIWSIRIQGISIRPLEAITVGMGLKERKEDYDKQVAKNAAVMFVQEIAADSLRHSDWLVTLVLMHLDLYTIAKHIRPDGEKDTLFAPHWGVVFQTFIILFGSVTRFFLNDLRPVTGATPAQTRITQVIGVASYLAATAFFVLSTINLLLYVGSPDDLEDGSEAQEQAYVVWCVQLVQIGYPVVTFFQILYLNTCANDLQPGRETKPMPSNQIDPWLSTFKDVAYGTLDTLSKGGLALYCALHASKNSL